MADLTFERSRAWFPALDIVRTMGYTGQDSHVLMYLLMLTNGGGNEIYYTNEELAFLMNVNVSTVKRALQTFKTSSFDFIEIENVGKKSNGHLVKTRTIRVKRDVFYPELGDARSPKEILEEERDRKKAELEAMIKSVF